MISKKEKILNTALELFASEGYTAVSTRRIAEKAGVSEGLIFRHYKSKKGLLDAIKVQAGERTINLFAPIILQADPKKAIRMAISLPFEIPAKEYPFWKLLFKLKWETDYSEDNKMQPLINKLSWSFSQLDYKSPKKEAEILSHIIEGISTTILRDGKEAQMSLKQFLIRKYG
ncbi:TetR/AcrR family transcriptional regulator [Poritiphilus flavus]|uniref:TetR family transcriptional regulator n=1 Tax=Poritiphilus flavus TaxID=2697053 RepID=A0A6L9EH90_9FLAO|nr:TetR/AcrR family transcriptional regulator [Poritiphilus flavus]NAS14012.1 TetR family transcriptional regulator [Poritiphilus flavus]